MNTLKLDISELEIGENQVKLFQKDYSCYFNYNETFKSAVILQPNSAYRSIAFSEITSPFMLIITSDRLINAKVNDFEVTKTKIVVLNTSISSIEIANVDLEAANVSICMWGSEK